VQGSALGTLQDADDVDDNRLEREKNQQSEIARLTHQVTDYCNIDMCNRMISY